MSSWPHRFVAVQGHFNWVGQCDVSTICVKFANAVASGTKATPAPIAPAESRAAAIGIALGVIAAVIVVLAVLVVFSRRRKHAAATTSGGGISL